MEKINDIRLTPTMERVRSGDIQMFREKNKDDRSFIRKDNCDVLLKHDNRAMYAKLIDNEWYWVNGCEECNGRVRNSIKSYMECDKHNVCEGCKASRSEIKETPWGTSKGWTCKPCYESQIEKKKEDFKQSDTDTEYTSEPICPNCGSVQSDAWEWGDEECGEVECGTCDVEMNYTKHISISYSTKQKIKGNVDNA